MAPLYVDTVAIRDALVSNSGTAETLELARTSDIAAFSVGTATESSGLLTSGILSAAQLSELAAEGAVGEVCGQFFAIDGSPRGLELASRSISISLKEIVAIPSRIMFVSGQGKGQAVIGALAGGLMTELFIDTDLAREALEALG
jgi:DNA-binding transcriptional regulator LsrR (DeoR family)